MGYDETVRVFATTGALLLTLVTASYAQVVTKVTSGDTVIVEGVGKVRLLGIRTTDESAFGFGRNTVPPQQPARSGPETPPPQAASAAIKLKPQKPGRTFLQQLVLGKTVRVQYDSYGDQTDRERAYLFLQDGTLVNAEMLRKGMARLDASRPFAHQTEFERLQKEAQASGLGIWTTSPK
jgi:endonuclease YncB( thermonuclease family)